MAESRFAADTLESLQRRAIEASKTVLNIEELRPYQVDLLGLLNGRDVLVAQPTGSGKSVVYQLLPFAFDILNVLRDQTLGDEEQEHYQKIPLMTQIVILIVIILDFSNTEPLTELYLTTQILILTVISLIKWSFKFYHSSLYIPALYYLR